MSDQELTTMQLVAQAASAFQLERTGHAPRAVTVVLSKDTLVITLHGALTPAELTMSNTVEGAAKVQEYHRQLFASSSELLRAKIKEITGLNVGMGAAEVEPSTGAVVHAFTSGTMVQVFLLNQKPSELTDGDVTQDKDKGKGKVDDD